MSIRSVSHSQIEELCHRHGVRTLALFGSAARNEMTDDSDVDVLVSFDSRADPSLFDLVRLQEDLEALFHRSVDLVEPEALTNPFRRAEILRTLVPLYEG